MTSRADRSDEGPHVFMQNKQKFSLIITKYSLISRALEIRTIIMVSELPLLALLTWSILLYSNKKAVSNECPAGSKPPKFILESGY